MGILACQSLRSVFCLSGMALGSRHCQGPAPGPFLSPHSRSPPMRPPWVFMPLQPSSVPWGGFPGQDMASGRQVVQDHTHSQQHATPQRSRGPSPHLHGLVQTRPLPPLPTHSSALLAPTKRGLLRAVWSPLPSPRGLRVVPGQLRSHPLFQSCNHTECACSLDSAGSTRAHREAVRSPVGRVTCSPPCRESRAVCRGHVRCAGVRAG